MADVPDVLIMAAEMVQTLQKNAAQLCSMQARGMLQIPEGADELQRWISCGEKFQERWARAAALKPGLQQHIKDVQAVLKQLRTMQASDATVSAPHNPTHILTVRQPL